LQWDRLAHIEWAEAVAQDALPCPWAYLDPGGSWFATSITLDDPITLMPRPVWQLEAVRIAERKTTLMEAVLQPNWPEASHHLPERIRHWTMTRQFTHLGTFFDRNISEGLLQVHYKNLAFRRMAAVALAIRLYEVDHGARPRMLAQLVPQYLAAVPQDPYAADGRTIGYRREGDQPLLYSVWRDGKDDGGSYETHGSSYFYTDLRGRVDVTESADLPFFLNGDRPRVSRPLSREWEEQAGLRQAGDEDREENVEGGDSDQDHGSGQQP
jgi:hypothetical protein